MREPLSESSGTIPQRRPVHPASAPTMPSPRGPQPWGAPEAWPGAPEPLAFPLCRQPCQQAPQSLFGVI